MNALDYVALDFFPDVFALFPPDATLLNAIYGVLHQFIYVNLPQTGIPITVPIVISENGWSTSSGRSYAQQAEVLEVIIRAVHQHRETFNIIGYELFNLRDADSSQDNIFCQFGLLRHDYSSKPAYAVLRKLVSELTRYYC